MRTIVAMTVAGMIAITASAAQADEKKADQKFCGHVESFRTHVTQLDGMTDKSTIGELRAQTDKVSKDANEITKAAGKMKTPTAKQFTTAVKKLKDEMGKISNDTTLEQARAKIGADVKNVRDSGYALSTEAGCPPAKE
jgi:hypothetical protein